MQATVKGTLFGFGPVKHGIAALGIAAALAIGAATAVTLDRDDSAAVGTSRAAAVAARQANHQHFLEINMLPEAARQATTDYRFLEANMLPGDGISRSVVTHSRMLFLEANLLPEAAPVVRTLEQVRFWDANILPGDDQPNIPPYSRNGESKY